MIKTLTNKHFIIAMIVAPILAIIAYFAVDHYVSEKPHEAIKGQSYPLVAKSNCRYESGLCTFKNGEIQITLQTKEMDNSSIEVSLSANQALEGAKIAIASEGQNAFPAAMKNTDNSATRWTTILPNTLNDQTKVQIALAINGSLYFGEASTIFTRYETSFSRENISGR